MIRAKLVQFLFRILVVGFFLCMFIRTSYYLYNGFWLQVSNLDLLTRTRMGVISNIVAILFFVFWLVSCWINFHGAGDSIKKSLFNRFTFYLWGAFGILLFKVHYDFAWSIRPVFGTTGTYQLSEYLQRVSLFCIGISLVSYLSSFG